jgi:hypothetical protein
VGHNLSREQFGIGNRCHDQIGLLVKGNPLLIYAFQLLAGTPIQGMFRALLQPLIERFKIGGQPNHVGPGLQTSEMIIKTGQTAPCADDHLAPLGQRL